MTRTIAVLLVALALAILPASAIELARDGNALVPVVVDDTQGIAGAVADLVAYLGKITGGQFETVKAADHRGGPALYVGAGYFRPSDGDAARDRWTLQQVVQIYTQDDGLYVTGGGTQGCVFAVYAFLEDFCGVRWFHPGELGEHVPIQPTLGFEEMSERQVPSFVYRNMWASSQTPDRRMYREHRAWMTRNRQGGAAISMGHNLFRIVPPELYDAHPEYFPLIGGERVDPRSGAAWQPELANPGVVKLAVDKARAAFDANPELYSFSLSVNDWYGWSESEEALAYDPPEFRDVQDRGKARRMIVFANEVAEEVAKTHPDRHLVFYAYKSTLEPPEEPECHAQVIPSICHWGIAADPFHRITAGEEISPSNALFRRCIEGWHRLADKLIAREYWTAPKYDPLLKAGVTPVLFEDIPYYRDQGFIGISSESNIDWGNLALNHYVASKLMWDAQRDPQELLDDYFAKYYGEAAQPMRTYFTRIWQVAYKAHLPEDKAVPISEEDISYLGDQLTEATEVVADDDLRSARVKMARQFFDTWRMRHDIIARTPTQAQVEAYVARLDGLAAEKSDALVANAYKAEFMTPLPEPKPYAGPELAALSPGAQLPEPPATTLASRGGAQWLVLVGEDRTIEAEATGVRVGPRYLSLPSWQVVTADGEPVASGHMPIQGSVPLSVAVPEPGLYQIQMAAGRNGCALIVKNCPAVLVGPGYKLCEKPGKMYFYVPRDAEQFTVTLFAGKAESALMRIYDPDGEQVFEGDSLSRDVVAARFAPTAEQRGRAWCLEIAPASEGILEDYQILLSKELPPYLATFAEGLLTPAQ